MKILVTGGAGFIGSNLVDRLVDLGHSVVIIDNLSTGFSRNINPKAKFYNEDVRSNKISQIFEKEKPEMVFHLAAQMDVRISTREPIYDSEVNIGGTINLLENCVKYNVKKIIYSNTGGALYGDTKKEDIPVDENYPIMPLSQYGISKHPVEHYLYLYYHNYGLKYTSIRYPNVYGPRQNPKGEAGVIAIFTDNIINNQSPIIFGDGKQTRDYVYVKDIVNANILSLTKGENNCFNLGSEKETSVIEIFEMLKTFLDFKGNPKFKPERIGEVKNIALSNQKAKELLGWEAKYNLLEGIKKTIDYYKNK